jgi:catechol 2,3-dioxygenase-like lactoylglutathione lyase family enzyme
MIQAFTFNKKTKELKRMSTEGSRFVNLCPVFACPDLRQTVKFYTEKLGFRSARHYDKVENFATLYRDEIEFVLVQARQGDVLSNTQRYGAGYDAYIDPATVDGVDAVYEEYSARGVKILSKPHMTAYGSYEFAIEDVDGRQIGIGRIAEQAVYFKDSDWHGAGDNSSATAIN